MPTNQLNLADFPNSPYAEELRRGLSRLQFAPPLEAEYTVSHLHRVRFWVRTWFSVSIVVAALFTLNQLRRAGIGNAISLAHVGLFIPCAAALVWLAWSRQYQRLYMPAARILISVFSALIATFIGLAIAGGRDDQLAMLTIDLVAVFFFAGLMYRQALVTIAITVTAFAASAIGARLPYIMLLKSMMMVTVTSVIAAIVYRDVEQAYRRNFLEGALIRELVTRDGLSGLMNRRAFDAHLLRVWQQALRDECSIAVLMIDIDHFKRFNDNFGHQAGDLALRSVAGVVQSFARGPLDLAARYGGEEFAVILYDLARPEVQIMSEELREIVQNLCIESPASAAAEITVSVGIGIAVPTTGRTPQGAIQLADEALYAAKNAGRNCTVTKGVEVYLRLVTGAFKSPRYVKK